MGKVFGAALIKFSKHLHKGIMIELNDGISIKMCLLNSSHIQSIYKIKKKV